MTLVVADVRAEARDVLVFELRRQDGVDQDGLSKGGVGLPAFEPGAHVEIELPNGLIRHYSLVNDWRERDRYVFAVGLAEPARGGSAFMHQMVRRGCSLTVRAIRNNFRLEPAARRFLFIAGGIGITPLLSMVRWCEAKGMSWRLVYAARSAQRAAFCETLCSYGEKVHFHFDDREGSLFDIGGWLASANEGEHVYCCGPQSLMAAVKAQMTGLPPAALHFEYFTAPVEGKPQPVRPDEFTIMLRKSGRTITVAPDKSILEVLEENGFMVPFSCREGMCRTCETGVCEGEVEHRDYVLSDEERMSGKTMMLCVSRAKSQTLVLDL